MSKFKKGDLLRVVKPDPDYPQHYAVGEVLVALHAGDTQEGGEAWVRHSDGRLDASHLPLMSCLELFMDASCHCERCDPPAKKQKAAPKRATKRAKKKGA